MTTNKLKFSTAVLNDQQEAAVLSPFGPTLVVAGAGSGKTTVLTKRFEYLVREKGIDAERILAVSFTNKSVSHIKKRIKKLLSDVVGTEKLKNLNIFTFHSLGMYLLKKLDKEFIVCNVEKSRDLVSEVIEENKLSLKAVRATTEILLEMKRNKACVDGFDLNSFLKFAARHKYFRNSSRENLANYFKDAAIVFEGYERKLKEKGYLDFPSMLLMPEKFLQEDPDFRNEWNNHFEAVLCDEFQDVEPVQLSIMKLLTENKRNIFCVGDPDQSIYGFRGAVPDIFERFNEHYQETKIYKLEENYRSTPEILQVANHLISKNYSDSKNLFTKRLITKKASGEKPIYFPTTDQAIEVNFVIQEILNLQKKKLDLSRIAVFNRNWSFSEFLMNQLRFKKIPFMDTRSFKDWNRMSIRDLRAWLCIATYEGDLRKLISSMERVIKRYAPHVGEETVKNLHLWAKSNGATFLDALENSENRYVQSFCERLKAVREIGLRDDLDAVEKTKQIMSVSGYLSYWSIKKGTPELERIKSMIQAAYFRGATLEQLNKNLQGLSDPEEGSVFVGTIHSAKGLEFDYVFVMNVSQGKLPSIYSLIHDDPVVRECEVAEERRLAYVAFTRAKKKLFISATIDKKHEESIFIKDVKDGDDLIQIRECTDEDMLLAESEIGSFDEEDEEDVVSEDIKDTEFRSYDDALSFVFGDED